MNRKALSHTALLATLGVVAFSSVSSAGSGRTEPQEAAASGAPAAHSMLDAWQALAGGLTPEQMQATGFSFDDAKRHEWFYTPVDRVGLRMGDLDEEQVKKLRALLDSGLGAGGTEKAFQIVGLEEVLFATSGGREMRNPGNYFLMTFGIPTTEGAWGWRFEGHHFSASFTIVDDRVVSGTPAFFGGNPARVPEDSEVHAGLHPFGPEEDLGFRLIDAFDDSQRARVILDVESPRDILTSNAERAELGPPEGIAVADMSETQRAIFTELMQVYGSRMNPALLDYQMAKINQAGVERVHFAWAGGTRPGEGHYYRIQGPTFVIEYDNTQGNANHVHSVWRDFEDDFGYDPLRQHLAADHDLEIASGSVARSTPGSGRKLEEAERAHQHAHQLGTPHSHSRR